MLRSNIIKISLFATGLSGIVAEYLLATLASYIISDTVFQWTMIVSIMLFSMGLGARISKYINTNLLLKFIYIEFALSVFVSFSTLTSYFATAYTIYSGILIYILSIIIGVLIGMELPLAVRINQKYESLKINVSSILENDYYGSLFGGVFFAFVGLPIIGLTYTPFILGLINFLVAVSLFIILQKEIGQKLREQIIFTSILVGSIIIIGLFIAKPVELYGEQRHYKDRVVYMKQSQYQKIVITQWKDNYWLYINGNQQLCTIDEIMYHEPIVHPVMQLALNPANVLILGGGDGCCVREVLKYNCVNQIDLVDLDPEMTKIGKENPILVKLNENALNNLKVNIINQDGYKYVQTCNQFYDVIIVDLPDPKTIDIGRLYTREFYTLCKKILRKNGFIITQAGSPYFATKAFLCIDKSIEAAGFNTIPIHNQIVTLGEWGWIIGSKNKEIDLKAFLLRLKFDNIKTKWINHEAMKSLTSFGKCIYPGINKTDSIKVNTIQNPVLHKYYLKGNWEIY